MLAKITEEKMLTCGQCFETVTPSAAITPPIKKMKSKMKTKIKSVNRIPAPAPAPAPAADTAADTAAAAARLAERAELVVRAAMNDATRLDFKSACSSLAASLGRETLTAAHVAAVRTAEQTVLRERTATFAQQRIVRITSGRVNVAAAEMRTGVVYARPATSPELAARIGEEIAAMESRAKLATGDVYYRLLGRIAAHRARLADIGPVAALA